MGEHHFNQTAIDAKEGKLPPKKKKLGRRETQRLLYEVVAQKMNSVMIGGNEYDYTKTNER